MIRRRTAQFRQSAVRRVLETDHGVSVETWLNVQGREAPLAILIHGWLGEANSTYVVSAAQALFEAGLSTARINLPDHGNTAPLNSSLFHSAKTDEVIDVCSQLALLARGEAGLVGFSLGGNFALRVAQRLPLWTLAVCPVVDPELTARRLDAGPGLYRWWFIRKWRRALRAKARAFPERYDFRELYRLGGVGAITDRLVRGHTEFDCAESYYAAYRLDPEKLSGLSACVIAAEDDPVIPVESVRPLADVVDLTVTPQGGHVGFIDSWAMTSWLDREIAARFAERLRGPAARAG